MATLEYLTPAELEYLANVPSSIESDILESAKIKRHAREILFLKNVPKAEQHFYLEAKAKIQGLIQDPQEYPEFLLDLSDRRLTHLPPEIHLLPRRAKFFYLDLSNNRFTSYFAVRDAITQGRSNHPIPFDAINLEENPLRDLPVEIIERGKFATENIEKYWMKHWAKPYTLSNRITDVVKEHRFNPAEVSRLLELLQETLHEGRQARRPNGSSRGEPMSLAH
ncbi:MAG: hypothetical protein ACFB21_07315 [Opitutales bacterium]